jgi:hypothetical protein
LKLNDIYQYGHTALIGSVDGFELTRDDVYCVMLSLLCVLAGPPNPATSQVPQRMDNLPVIYEYITRAKIDNVPVACTEPRYARQISPTAI